MQWTDALTLGLRGQAYADLKHPYDRLPARARGVVTDSVWELSRTSAGLYVDFDSNASALHARAILRRPPDAPQQYLRWLDLYCRDGAGKWRWAGFSRQGFVPSGQTPLVEGLPAAPRHWRLYLPLSYRVERLEIGVPEGCSLTAAAPDPRRPIVVYGTSIVHGLGHLSRPGMVWTSIVGRQLDWPLVNLGFSGAARCEADLAPIVAEPDAAVFVIDPLPNMNTQLVEERGEHFLRVILDRYPKTPLLMIEDRTHTGSWLLPDYAPDQRAKRAAWRTIGEKLRAEGKPIGYLPGQGLIGLDDEATTDGSHPSDLGAMRYAEAVTPMLRQLLSA